MSQPGSLLHIFWECPKIQAYWQEVETITEEITGNNISFQPQTCLLHLNEIERRNDKHSLLIHLPNAAQACIPMLRKSEEPPTINYWLQRILDIKTMKDLTAAVCDIRDRFVDTWEALIIFSSSDVFWNPDNSDLIILFRMPSPLSSTDHCSVAPSQGTHPQLHWLTGVSSSCPPTYLFFLPSPFTPFPISPPSFPPPSTSSFF